MSTATNKPYILVDGFPCVISVAYSSNDGIWVSHRFVGKYTCMHELNKDMPRFIKELPEGWTIEVDFQDYYDPKELQELYNDF